MNSNDQPEPKSPEYRQGRIDAIQEYLDTCEKEGVPPGSITLHQFQQGQLLAQKEIESRKPDAQAEVGLREKLRSAISRYNIPSELNTYAFADEIMSLLPSYRETQDKDFHKMTKAMGKRLRELAAIPSMEQQYDKELVRMAADVYSLGFRDMQQLIDERCIKLLDEVYALAPKKSFENWKPQDALQFFERLKALEARFQPPTAGEGESGAA